MTRHPLDDLLTAHGVEALVPSSPPDPQFSVIVRTQGRRPRSLREAVASVLAQSWTNFELLVVAHGDASVHRSALESLPPDIGSRPHRVLSVRGGGRSRPLNVGLDAAQGDFVCFLDDDLARPNWFGAFAAAAREAPCTVIRAVTETQEWTTDGSDEPSRPTGSIETPFAPTFDLLAHMSGNSTPICSIAVPRASIERFGARFDESLPVFEDWEFLVRVAMLVGVTSIPEATTLYRRLDRGNAHSAHDDETWLRTHAAVIDRLSARPVLLPAGDARRLASSHFEPGGASRYGRELLTARAEINALTRSPLQEHKFGLLAAADALINPSPHESFSIVVIEAMLVGTPVLVNGRCPPLRGHCENSGAASGTLASPTSMRRSGALPTIHVCEPP